MASEAVIPLARGVRRVPRPLAVLLVLVALMGVSWALLTPAWQVPDEGAHFAYVETLAQQHRLPGDAAAPAFSSAAAHSMGATNTEAVILSAGSRPEWSRDAYEAYLRGSRADKQDDGGGVTGASNYPPAYYLLTSLGYRLAGSGDVLTHLYASRLFSVIWLLLTTAGVWLLAGELFTKRWDAQLVAAAAVGLWPMLDFMSASVNPDSLTYATWSLALWLGVRVLRRGLTVGSAAGLGLVVAIALLTKASNVALLPAAAFALLVAAVRLGRRQPRAAVLAALGALVTFAVPVLAWRLEVDSQGRPAFAQVTGAAAGALNVREFLSYVWQYYLPSLPFQDRIRYNPQSLSQYPTLDVWIATGWGAFGALTVRFPPWAYRLFGWITLAVGVLALSKVASVVRHRRAPGFALTAASIAVFLGLAAAVLVLGLHLAEYRLKYQTNQGRYLFPLAGIAGCAVALAVDRVPARARHMATGLVLGGIVAFQLVCLGLVAHRFYA